MTKEERKWSIAAALWREEADRAGQATVAMRRTPEAFADAGEVVQDRWLRQAQAALDALAPVTALWESALRAHISARPDCPCSACDATRAALDTFR